MDYSGKTIWITGASSGIGQAVAIELSKAGAHLILSGRNEEALAETASGCNENGSTTRLVPFDLTNESQIISAVESVLSDGPVPDCLYQFGGVSQRSFAQDTPVSIDRKIFEVNFFGTVALTKALLPAMIANGGGHIAVTSSIVGKFGFPWRSAYSASKHALHGFYESLRAECKSNNIRISVIVPGRIRTSISINALDNQGRSHGKMDAGQATGMSAEKGAEKICRHLQKESKEIIVGGREIIMVYIRRFIPPLYYYLSTKVKPL